MSSVSLSLNDVCVSYEGKPAISDVNVDVNRGEVYGLMGLNGAGKTTMIKSILSLRDQDSGEIRINGELKTSKNAKSQISYLPEKFEPPWFLNGMEFLKFSLSLYGQEFLEDEMYAAAEQLALDRDALKRRVHTYSKGMRQKLGIIGTLFTNSSVIILDEPMSGLDPLARSRVKSLILNTKRHDRTIFLSSHVLADMDEICDRVSLLHEGQVRFTGTASELKKITNKNYLEHAFLEFIENKSAA